MSEESGPPPRFAIPLPGGRVARVPAELLLQHVEADAVVVHGVQSDADDVVAHDMTPDHVTGVSDYHTDWEHGECYYDDGSGQQQRIVAWHRHPFGTEYTEIFEG